MQFHKIKMSLIEYINKDIFIKKINSENNNLDIASKKIIEIIMKSIPHESFTLSKDDENKQLILYKSNTSVIIESNLKNLLKVKPMPLFNHFDYNLKFDPSQMFHSLFKFKFTNIECIAKDFNIFVYCIEYGELYLNSTFTKNFIKDFGKFKKYKNDKNIVIAVYIDSKIEKKINNEENISIDDSIYQCYYFKYTKKNNNYEFPNQDSNQNEMFANFILKLQSTSGSV